MIISLYFSTVTEIQVSRALDAIVANNSLITEITLTCSSGSRNSADTWFKKNTLFTAAEWLKLLTRRLTTFLKEIPLTGVPARSWISWIFIGNDFHIKLSNRPERAGNFYCANKKFSDR